MSTEDLFIEVYKKFYEQREVLSEAPVLTQNPEEAEFNFEKADEELQKVISYLMGVPDVQQLSFEETVDILQKHYANQPEWKNLLIQYFIYATEKKKEGLEKHQEEIIQKIEEAAKEILFKE